MKKYYFLIATIFTLFISGCNKKDKISTNSKADLLTSRSWKLTGLIEDENGDGIFETNSLDGFEDCYKDNYYIFNKNGQLELNEGATKCDPSDPQSDETTWQLTNNDSLIVIGGDTWTLEELTNTTLKWKEMYSDNSSAIVTFTKR